MDAMAKVESGLKEYEDRKNAIMAEVKKYTDAYTQARQGFDSMKNCFSNPTTCGKAYRDSKRALKGIVAIGRELTSGDLVSKSPKNLAESVRQEGTYKKGQGKDIRRRNEMEEKNNAAVTANIARLFAKGMVTRQSIRLEEEDIYEAKFEKNDMDEVLYAQNKMTLNNKRRIAHILELRSYMNASEALKELTQYNRKTDQD